MKFYNRESELKILDELDVQSGTSGRMTVITGRRRVGKTLLANEIDIVAINDLDKRILIVDVKLNSDRINIEVLKRKSVKLVNNYKGYKVEFAGLSLDDLERYL